MYKQFLSEVKRRKIFAISDVFGKYQNMNFSGHLSSVTFFFDFKMIFSL